MDIRSPWVRVFKKGLVDAFKNKIKFHVSVKGFYISGDKDRVKGNRLVTDFINEVISVLNIGGMKCR